MPKQLPTDIWYQCYAKATSRRRFDFILTLFFRHVSAALFPCIVINQTMWNHTHWKSARCRRFILKKAPYLELLRLLNPKFPDFFAGTSVNWLMSDRKCYHYLSPAALLQKKSQEPGIVSLERQQRPVSNDMRHWVAMFMHVLTSVARNVNAVSQKCA